MPEAIRFPYKVQQVVDSYARGGWVIDKYEEVDGSYILKLSHKMSSVDGMTWTHYKKLTVNEKGEVVQIENPHSVLPGRPDIAPWKLEPEVEPEPATKPDVQPEPAQEPVKKARKKGKATEVVSVAEPESADEPEPVKKTRKPRTKVQAL